MAKEFTTRNGLNREQYIALASETMVSLKWNSVFIGEDRIEAVTRFSPGSWNEKFVVSLDPTSEEVSLSSVCLRTQIYDFGKNKRNIEDFIIALHQLKKRVSRAELRLKEQEIVDRLKNKSELKGEKDEKDENKANSRLSTSMSFKETMYALIPTKDCFVNPILIYVNVFIFLLMVLCGVSFIEPTNMDIIQWGANYGPLTLDGEWWRLLTSCFLHIGFMHLFLNMYALLYIGVLLEPILRGKRYFVAYILTGIISSSVSLLVHSNTISAGASGAIFGMYGLFLVLLFAKQTHTVIRKQFLASIIIFVLSNLLYGLKDGVDNAAHMGGLLSGIAIGFTYLPSLKAPDNKPLKLKIMAIASVCTLLVALLIYNITSNDEAIYRQKLDEFTNTETVAKKCENIFQTGTDEQILQVINTTIIPSWEKNLALVQSLDSLNIDEKELVHELIRYSTVRIQYYTAIKKSVSEHNPDEYQSEIAHYASELNKIINEINANIN